MHLKQQIKAVSNPKHGIQLRKLRPGSLFISISIHFSFGVSLALGHRAGLESVAFGKNSLAIKNPSGISRSCVLDKNTG